MIVVRQGFRVFVLLLGAFGASLSAFLDSETFVYEPEELIQTTSSQAEAALCLVENARVIEPPIEYAARSLNEEEGFFGEEITPDEGDGQSDDLDLRSPDNDLDDDN